MNNNRKTNRPNYGRPGNSRPTNRPGSRPGGSRRPDSRSDSRSDSRPKYDRPKYERPDSRSDSRPKYDRPKYERPDSRSDSRPKYDRPKYDRPKYDRPKYEQPTSDSHPKDTSPQDSRPKYNRPKHDRPTNDRPSKKTARFSKGGKDARPGATGTGLNVNVRQLAAKILADFDDRPGDPERIADKLLSRKRLDIRDRRLVFELVYGVLRNRLYLDYVIDALIPAGRTLEKNSIRRILLLGAYQILFLDRVPDHASVNESVNLAKHDRTIVGASGFVNAILRNVIKNKHKITLPDSRSDLCGRLSIEFSHPKWMIERWLSRYGLSATKKILDFNNTRPSTWLRRSMRGISRQQFEADVRTLCEQGGGYLGLYYKMTTALDPESLRLVQNGMCSVQAPSSGWAVAMADLRKGQRVVDLCGAPGGKATLAAELAGAEGTVVVCDISRWKMGMVSEAIRTHRFDNIYPIVCDSAQPPFTGQFDVVFLDVPCSGTGVLQRHPDGRVTRKIEDIAAARELQRHLLNSAATMIGVGGLIVYSTCSLESEENEEQVEWFLENHPNYKLDTPPDVIPAMFIDDKKCLRITPHDHGMDGMFAARFCRVG